MNRVRQRLNIDELYQSGLTGEGTTAAIIDTGVASHLDLVMPKNRIIDFFDCIAGGDLPYDDNGHGTAVATILAGNGAISCGKYRGVAPRANIVGVKAIGSRGEGSGKLILQAMEYVLENANRLKIRVVCMSFGSQPIDPDPIILGAEALWQSGIVVVASSGNDGPAYKTVMSPGASPRILTVGGVDFFDSGKAFVVPFSSRGPYGRFTRPDVVAPSVDIVCGACTEFYAPMSGTSMSAPILAGICCLILEAHPEYTPDRLKEVIITSATPVDNDPNASGYGLVNPISATQ